jgi:hypothetical protein
LPIDATIAGLVELAQKEFRLGHYATATAMARLISEYAPNEPESQRLISLIATMASEYSPAPPLSADHGLSCYDGHRALSDNEAAALNYRIALIFNRNLHEAHLGLARLRMPGDDYLVWLERLHHALAPETVIEIGVFQGASLALVQPPTIAIGVDPNPTVIFPLKTETHIFTETSDEFFASGRLDKLLAGRPLSVGFIDGLHLFEQALRDFINIESCCKPDSVILLHDTVPIDQPTQSRTRDTQFHTGDVWKTILCLKHYRPDLDIFTIATPPTGLTVVTGLDPTSRVLTDRYDEAVARFIDTSFTAVEHTLETMLNVVSNDWDIVESRLKERRII